MRFVIKLGTSLLTSANNHLDRDFLRTVISDIAALHKKGHEIIIVSSGAVSAGRGEISFDREKKNIPYRQALASIGQGILMDTYRDFFKSHGITIAQALLTNFDFTNRQNFLNTKNVFEILLTNRVIPIVNENDVTTIAELKFGDNDMLSAKTAAMVSADFLCILTDVDGLFEEDPKRNPHARLIPYVAKITEQIRASAGEAASSKSLGGMVTKLEAASYITSVGISMCIAYGKRKGIVRELSRLCLEGSSNKNVFSMQKLCTFFASSVNKLASQKKWLRPKIQKNAWIEIDEGACRAITQNGKSLLPGGVMKVSGEFSRGDVVMVKASQKDIGYGQVNYDASDLNKIKKHHTSDIEKILRFSFEDEVIHRDRMVVLPGD